MDSEATITFTQPGVQPPVYVVTSLSTPPWAPLELKPSKEKTPAGDFVFEHKFGNVAEGSYQYKIRIGEGHWVVDHSKESATDEHGNCNNVVHVKPANSPSSLDRTTKDKDILDRKDSTLDTSSLNPGPIPFVVVEKVMDKDQPEYGHVQPKSLSVDDSKRAADPDPDFEETTADSPLDTEHHKSEVPLVVVEKVDDEPAHGDDFGKNATSGQKLAHELRSADASPDQLIISPEEPGELDPPSTQAPLFRHESFQDSEASLPDPEMETIEEESTQYSTDHTSSGDAVYTPSAESQDELQDEDELGHCPLLPHETGFADKVGELKSMPLLSHETELGAADDDEFDRYEEDEYDAAPLLSHETGFSSYKGSESSRLTQDEYEYEPEHYMRYGDDSEDGDDYGELDHAPTFAHEQDLLAEDYGAPLLPHERGSVDESMSGSERSFSMSPTTYDNAYPAFGQQTDSAQESFGSMRSSFFRTRTSSSREQILERVATIGHKLPEDETHGAPTSPQPSVLSQACSSVDLVPVKSYISLASVREDSEEEDEDENADVESLPSPVYMSNQSARFARGQDPLATSHPDDSKQLGVVSEDKPKVQNTRTAEAGEADSGSRPDGVKGGLINLSDLVASKATVMNTLTPPITPGGLQALSGRDNSAPVPESELRQRREPVEDNSESSTSTPCAEDNGDNVSTADPSMVTLAAEKLKPTQSSLQHWQRVR
ncbi:hypothetical protein EJ07DRAFT_167413 [Lizonia empirigonia]|nr:hypothetical protein EJ07DRAFT_167413 [Lizonia empirigonia]